MSKSELLKLLEKNADSREKDLTEEEIDKALELINTPGYRMGNCSLCEVDCTCIGEKPKRAIYDTNVCKEHALYLLHSKK